MSPKDDAENWRTLKRFGLWLKGQPVLIGLAAYALGGGSGTLIEKFAPEKPNPQMDSIMIAVRQAPAVQDSLASHGKAIERLQGDVDDLDGRLAQVEPDNSRAPYRRPRGVGRWRE